MTHSRLVCFARAVVIARRQSESTLPDRDNATVSAGFRSEHDRNVSRSAAPSARRQDECRPKEKVK
jgi:hypothetical protein